MSKKSWYIITYDVREPKRLRKVGKHLKGYGERLQYSVFRCRLTERELERLRWELVKIMDDEDNLLIIGLCAKCGTKVAARHGAVDWADKPATFEIV